MQDALIEVLEENKRLRDNVIEKQEALIRNLTEENNRLRCELAPHRVWDDYSRQQPWRYCMFLMLKDVFPFSLWYHRHDG